MPGNLSRYSGVCELPPLLRAEAPQSPQCSSARSRGGSSHTPEYLLRLPGTAFPSVLSVLPLHLPLSLLSMSSPFSFLSLAPFFFLFLSLHHLLRKTFFCFFFIIIYFWLCWVFIATLRLSPVAVIRGYSPVAACGLLIAVVSLVVEQVCRLSSCVPWA